MLTLRKNEVRVESERVFLRILTKEDAVQAYCDWLNDTEVNKYLETRRISLKELDEYIDSKYKSDSCLFFGIFWKENGLHIGNIKLEPIDFIKKCATIGIIMGDKEYWGKGVATEAVNILVDYAFRELGLKEINLGVIAENKPAIRVYEKCGFQIYNVRKKALKHDNQFFDHVLMYKKSKIYDRTYH